MKRALLPLLAAILLLAATPTPSKAAPADDVTANIHHFIDAFNSGEFKAFYAAFAAGSVSIVDEFAPHFWAGPHAAQTWGDDYDKHAKATGVTDGVVAYGEPTRKVVSGALAYVIVPCVYKYKENGKATEEEGQLTFVLHHEAGAWKIRSWTWTGVYPHPAK